MRLVSRVLVGLVAFQCVVTTAWACKCVQVTPEEAVDSGDLLVVATITNVRRPPVGCGGATRPLRVAVEVVEVISGDGVAGRQIVHTNRDSAACGLDLNEGETWVLQVSGDDDTVSLCSAAKKLDGDDDPWLVALRDAAAR